MLDVFTCESLTWYVYPLYLMFWCLFPTDGDFWVVFPYFESTSNCPRSCCCFAHCSKTALVARLSPVAGPPYISSCPLGSPSHFRRPASPPPPLTATNRHLTTLPHNYHHHYHHHQLAHPRRRHLAHPAPIIPPSTLATPAHPSWSPAHTFPGTSRDLSARHRSLPYRRPPSMDQPLAALVSRLGHNSSRPHPQRNIQALKDGLSRGVCLVSTAVLITILDVIGLRTPTPRSELEFVLGSVPALPSREGLIYVKHLDYSEQVISVYYPWCSSVIPFNKNASIGRP